jgi:hypothetical protein
MRKAKGPNHPAGGSTKVNGQVVTPKPKKDDSAEDETAAFLASMLSEEDDDDLNADSGYLPPDYSITSITRASAMMMGDYDTILLEGITAGEPQLEVALPTAAEETNDHTRVCGPASHPTHPAQAVTATHGARSVTAASYPHDRSSLGSTSRKGPDLGGSKAAGVTVTVVSPPFHDRLKTA